METVQKLEKTIASWYKDVPHLPANAQKWLAENIWWLALVGVVLGTLTIFAIIVLTLFAGVFLASIGGPAGAVVGGIAFIAVFVALLFFIAAVVIAGMAITPLKALRKKGWTLLFIITLINAVAQGVEFLFSFNVFGLIWGLLFVAVGAYFLFEIRSFFGGGRRQRKS